MDSTLLIAAGASFVAGLLGYIIARFWIKPKIRDLETVKIRIGSARRVMRLK